jgi:hypothetical protein
MLRGRQSFSLSTQSSKLSKIPQGSIKDIVNFNYLKDSLEERIKHNDELNQ